MGSNLSRILPQLRYAKGLFQKSFLKIVLVTPPTALRSKGISRHNLFQRRFLTHIAFLSKVG